MALLGQLLQDSQYRDGPEGPACWPALPRTAPPCDGIVAGVHINNNLLMTNLGPIQIYTPFGHRNHRRAASLRMPTHAHTELMQSERSRTKRRLYNQSTDTDTEAEIETAQLDYGGQNSRGEEQTLPPAWEPEPSTWTVGYEAIGATSIGVEQERRTQSRRRGLRVKSTKLADHNEGRHPSDGTQGERLAELDKKRITQALCSTLKITGLLEQEAVRALLLLDLRRFGRHKAIPKVALATICVIVDYHRRYKRRDQNAERLGSDPHFKMLSHELGLADAHIQLSRKVKEELRQRDFFDTGAPGLGMHTETVHPTGSIGELIAKPLFMTRVSDTK